MKKLLYILLLILCFCHHTKAQLVLIPDSNFRNVLIAQGFGSCMTGNYINSTCAQVTGCTNLTIYNKNISDLTGISVFTHLTSLDCSNNQLTSLPTLPNSLVHLYCSFNQLTSLPPLPNALYDLECENNQITSLPTLPNSLANLYCYFNQLTSLPPFPNSLLNIDCHNNQLTSLPLSLNSLQSFDCNTNQLTSLPSLPNTLIHLECDDNQLTSLPPLPNFLQSLACNTNQLISLPALPDSLVFLDCSFNPSLSCLPQLKKINTLFFTNTNITCLPNYGQVTNSTPLLSTLPLCGYFNPGNCSVNWNISGKTYLDADSNCVFSTGDVAQSNFKLNLYKNGNLIQQAYSGGEGLYSFDTDSLDIYTTALDTTGIPFDVLCPVSLNYQDTLTATDSLKYNNDFAIKCKSGVDLGVWSIHTFGFRTADNVLVNVNAGDYSNLYGAHCANGTGGTVTIIYTGPVSFVSADTNALSPTAINGDTLIYSVADFGTVNYQTAFNFILSVDTNAITGSAVIISVAISSLNDNNPSNNFITQSFIVLSSYDPNEKTVYPPNGFDINGDHWLTYNINFQNTGTDYAEDIFITDTLDANLDWSTFTLLGYSKQPYVQILPDGVAKFTFIHIVLPDSSADEPNSHGYVQYKIKAKSSLPVGATISNTANIYFDYNVPVVTNTVTNTITVTGIHENNFSGITVLPNPFYDQFKIVIPVNLSNEQNSVTIYDALGRIVDNEKLSSGKTMINTANWGSGIYLLQLHSGGKLFTQKIIKQ